MCMDRVNAKFRMEPRKHFNGFSDAANKAATVMRQRTIQIVQGFTKKIKLPTR